jgi:hypothetical protein
MSEVSKNGYFAMESSAQGQIKPYMSRGGAEHYSALMFQSSRTIPSYINNVVSQGDPECTITLRFSD